MDFVEALKLISSQTNGIVSVLIVIGLIVFYILVDKKIIFNAKQTEHKIDDGFRTMSDKIVEQNQKLIDSIIENNKLIEEHNTAKFDKVASVFENIITERDNKAQTTHKEKLTYRLDISEKINNDIRELMHYSHADRIELVEFHNSKENLNQLSFLWYDVQYQQIDSYSIKPVDVRSHPVSLITPIISDITNSEDGIIMYNKTKMDALEKENPSLKYHIENYLGIKEFVASGLYDSDGRIIGFMSLDYVKTPLTKEILDYSYIHDTSVAISNLLRFDEN